MLNILKILQYKWHYKNRIEKLNIFINFVKPLPNEIILDVGIASKEFHHFDNMLEKINKSNKYNYKIIGLSIEKNIKNLSQIKDKYNILCVQYNGKDFPFKDSSIDIVYSNAVIEHVGNFERQLFFLSEMLRIAKRCVFFTTPNKYFPIELHTKIPFIHFFPKNISDKIYNFLGKGWATGDYMNLLSKKDILLFLQYLENLYDFHYKIIPQKFLGFIVTFSVIIFKK